MFSSLSPFFCVTLFVSFARFYWVGGLYLIDWLESILD